MQIEIVDLATGAVGPRRSRRMLTDGLIQTLAVFTGGTGARRCAEMAQRLDVLVRFIGPEHR